MERVADGKIMGSLNYGFFGKTIVSCQLYGLSALLAAQLRPFF
jgi:hypothetical protein